jgi:two-component system LytT family response regulator
MKPLRVVIAEDEPLAREVLLQHASRLGGLEVVGIAGNGQEMVDCVRRMAPHLLFLDVRMPGESGLEALGRISPPRERPWVVVTSAYGEFALDAFDLRAVDYLLKPFSFERFSEAVGRVRSLVEETLRLRRLSPALYSDQDLERLFVRRGSRLLPVSLSDVRFLEASDGGVRVHLVETAHLVFLPLRDLARRLDARFLQISRSVVVNLQAIERVERLDRRRLSVVLRDGTRLVASRSGSRALRGRELHRR